MEIKIGHLKVFVRWKPNTLPKLWRGGRLTFSFMFETKALRQKRNNIRALRRTRQVHTFHMAERDAWYEKNYPNIVQ